VPQGFCKIFWMGTDPDKRGNGGGDVRQPLRVIKCLAVAFSRYHDKAPDQGGPSVPDSPPESGHKKTGANGGAPVNESECEDTVYYAPRESGTKKPASAADAGGQVSVCLGIVDRPQCSQKKAGVTAKCAGQE